jgi:branched-subunit amino acid ABC-type transport system permease component
MIYSKYQFFASAFAILIIVLVWLFLERTPYGAIIKAGAHDSEMVRALGINLTRLRLFVFGFGTALAALVWPDVYTLIANPQVRDYLGHLTQNIS